MSNDSQNKSNIFWEVIIVSFILLGLAVALYGSYQKKKQNVLDKRSDVPVLMLNNIESLKENNASSEKKKIKVPQAIVVGQFKTNYFFEENFNLLKDHDLDPQVRVLNNGHRQIYLKVSPNDSITHINNKLKQLKLLKLVPSDAFVKFK